MNLHRAIVACCMLCACLSVTVSAQRTHVLLVSGISGEDRFAQQWRTWSERLATALVAQGVASGDVIRLAERTGQGVRARATKDEISRQLLRIASTAAPSDQVLLVIFGHGAVQGDEARLNLPGPDLSARELAVMLRALPTDRVVVVNTASASGPFVGTLAGAGRAIIAATRSGAQNNETIFGDHFTAAYAEGGADTDKDGRVSLLEAFNYTQHEVARAYSATNRMRSEHALLDADGDGTGTVEPDAAAGDGRAASTIFFGAAAGSAVAGAEPPAGASPELRALYSRRADVQQRVDAHRARKDSMAADAYERELERLLVDLALVTQQIRQLEGGSP